MLRVVASRYKGFSCVAGLQVANETARSVSEALTTNSIFYSSHDFLMHYDEIIPQQCAQ